ncbi:MAG TPA: formyltransferase family protein [Terriglobales bacterium]|jgi:folate-dependent phosphoribosylglycinamide formyltransferase PurN|nr:formyltransferase family protein [Terriglobales bacterium]
MRVVILCPSPYSETTCALAACVAKLGYVPVGALTLPSWDHTTLMRKFGQWGMRDSLNYAVSKLAPARRAAGAQIRNPYLEKTLRNGNGIFRSLRDVARSYGFPVAICRDQNSPRAVAQLEQWAPDVAVFTGGNILRDQVLRIPRLGVLNSHLALLPEIRGMSSPEWALLCDVPLGITIHFMDSGVDTGPILLRREFAAASQCESLTDLRNRMIAEGIDLIAEALTALDRNEITAAPQVDREKDNQYFVMHERLKTLAARRLKPRNGEVNPGFDACAKSAGTMSRHDG